MAESEGLDKSQIESLVLAAIRLTNQARKPDSQLDDSPTALLYAPKSPLDSLGLVALLIDLEELLADAGYQVTLSDERAMSLRYNPFRDVPSLVDYIAKLLQAKDT